MGGETLNPIKRDSEPRWFINIRAALELFNRYGFPLVVATLTVVGLVVSAIYFAPSVKLYIDTQANAMQVLVDRVEENTVVLDRAMELMEPVARERSTQTEILHVHTKLLQGIKEGVDSNGDGIKSHNKSSGVPTRDEYERLQRRIQEIGDGKTETTSGRVQP